MKKSLVIAILLLIVFTNSPLLACTAFFASQGDKVLVGNNEDYINPITKIWFEPAEDKKYGRVYFGFDNLWPQGGMNDQGLFFDAFATQPKKIKISIDKPKYQGNLIEKVMAECATVEEVINIFDRYNLQFMEKFMLMFADKTGASAIIEGDVVIRKEGPYQVITNFYQSKIKDRNYPCERYKIATEMLKKNSAISVKLFRQILAAVHAEGEYVNTLYSNIYDLQKGIVYLYHFHDFANEVVIDLDEELKKGKHIYDLPSLFPRTFHAESFLSVYKKRNEMPVVDVDSKIFDKYIGIYEMPSNMAPNTAIAITKRGEKLYGFYPELPQHELLPQSENHFVTITDSGEIKLTFKEGKAGEVTEIFVESDRSKFTVKKIK